MEENTPQRAFQLKKKTLNFWSWHFNTEIGRKELKKKNKLKGTNTSKSNKCSISNWWVNDGIFNGIKLSWDKYPHHMDLKNK